MTALTGDAGLPLWRRLVIYQAERFPLIKTSVLLAAFSSASINVSAFLAGRPLPSLTTYALVWIGVLVVFFQMRAADEWKDYETDRLYRPERPIPRGLFTLRFILTLGAALAPLALLAAYLVTPGLVWLLALVWLWLGLMTVEFFAPEWLKARPLVYLVSHMAIMPLIDLFTTGAEWLPAGAVPPDGLWLFLLLSFLNGCVIEIGRKLYARENEGPGIETYSALWGPGKAATVWAAVTTAALAALVWLGFKLGAPLTIAIAGVLAWSAVVWCAWTYANDSSPARQRTADTLAGLWVLVCYLAAGFLPLLGGAAS